MRWLKMQKDVSSPLLIMIQEFRTLRDPRSIVMRELKHMVIPIDLWMKTGRLDMESAVQ